MDLDPLRIGVRAAASYLVLLALMRLTGKRTVSHSSPFDFTVALVIGDLVDDAIWAEVVFAQFVVAAGSLVMVHMVLDVWRYRAGMQP